MHLCDNPAAVLDEAPPTRGDSETDSYTDCVACLVTGVCLPCKGSGKSGYFLKPPSVSAPTCSRCKGTGACGTCRGAGRLRKPSFRPYIYVVASLHTPTSIMGAIFMGGSHREIQLPAAILQRSHEAQRGWITWRVRKHFRDNDGKCRLFGDIVGYLWYQKPTHRLRFSTRGILLENSEPEPRRGVGSLTIGNKTIRALDGRGPIIRQKAGLERSPIW
jgi:hypothetical protein